MYPVLSNRDGHDDLEQAGNLEHISLLKRAVHPCWYWHLIWDVLPRA